MDKRVFNGGHSNGGRKSKAEEQKLVERLSPLNDLALTALKNALEKGSQWAVKLYFEYYYGKPTKVVEIGSSFDKNDHVEVDYSKLSTECLEELLNACKTYNH